jgi:tetratricopeptide (TPR) repeat protein/4-amino-4-deoxy-L-arabinose transferase-like glycosyltransferase
VIKAALDRIKWNQWLMICLVLLLAASLRFYNLSIVDPQYPQLTADSIEYKAYGEFLLRADKPRPIADRPPAFPLVLGVLYSVVDVENNRGLPQRILTTSFDIVAIFLLFLLGSRVYGEFYGVLAGALYALNGELIRNSLLAGTEQFYMCISLALFLGFLRLAQQYTAALYWGVLMGSAALVLTKQEGFLILGAHLVFYWTALQGSKVNATQRVQRVVPIGAVAGIAYAGYKYYSGQVLAIPTMNYRTGNALFHAEFLADRMPWGYMRDLRNEYFRISNFDWLVGYHSPGEILHMIFDSTLLIGRYLVEMLGGPPFVLLMVLGVFYAFARGEKLQILILFFLSVLPMCLFAEQHSRSSYTPRLLVPAMPFMLLLIARGCLGLVEMVSRHSTKKIAVIAGCATLALYAMANIAPVHAIGEYPSLRSAGLAASTPQIATAELPVDSDDMVSKGMALQILKKYGASREAFETVLRYREHYAPAMMGLALVALAQGDEIAGKRHLHNAIDRVPYYAEGYTALAALALKNEHYDDAVLTVRECVKFRPDYSPCWYILGNLLLDYERDYAGAADAYEHYAQLNRALHVNYLDFVEKRRYNNPQNANLQRAWQEAHQLSKSNQASMLTPTAWWYLNMGKSGGLTQRVKPDDQLLYYYWGLAYEMAGQIEEAMGKYRQAVQVNPRLTPIAERLRTYDTGVEKSVSPIREPLSLSPVIHRADMMYRHMLEGQHDPRYQQYAGGGKGP